MIIEQPIINILSFEAYDEDAETWTPWTGDLQTLKISRGGKRLGVAVTVDPGTLSADLINTSSSLKPNTRLRVGIARENGFTPIFTGRVADLTMTTRFDKRTGDRTHVASVTATDAVAAHAATTRFGVQAGEPETFAQRIRRLAESSIVTVETPEDDSPRVVYAL